MNSVKEWNQYWNSASAPQSDALFTDAEGKAIKDFVVFWEDCFSNSDKDSHILDVACGSGALFKSVSHLPSSNIAGLDCSEHALALFKEAFPHSRTILNSSEQLPNDVIGTFDKVVSQFGIEYLGKETLAKLPLQLKKGAEFVALCHYQDGHIHSRYAAEKNALVLLSELRVVEQARQLATGLFVNPDSALPSMSSYFKTLEANKLLWNAGALHFIQGAYQLLGNYKQYNKSDIVNWIEGMDKQLQLAFQRVSAICDVALSKQDVDDVIAFSNQDHQCWTAKPFYMASSKLPVAWELRFKKVQQLCTTYKKP